MMVIMMIKMMIVPKQFHLLPVCSCLGRLNKVLHQAVQRLPEVVVFRREDLLYFYKQQNHLVRSFEARVAFSLEAASELPLRPI